MAGEFDLIANYFNWPAATDSVKLSVGDDAAIVSISRGHKLVISVDTLVAGVHYPFDTSPIDIGYKSLIVNLSDIAAMGADPRWFTLALTLPEYDSEWLSGFSIGLKQAADEYGVALIGGDTTRGSSTITIQIMGEVADGTALKRSAAQPNDDLYITNTLGDAAAGLKIHQAGTETLSDAERSCVTRLNRPTARIAESKIISQYANACMDISDGLLQDLSHILKASQLGATLNTAELTMSAALDILYTREESLKFALCGGDDYELLFSVSEQNQALFKEAMRSEGFDFQIIGKFNNHLNTILDQDGNALSANGFQHF